MQDEVRTVGALDGLRHLGISGVHQSAYPAADTPLPVGERLDVSVDAGIVGRVCHGRFQDTIELGPPRLPGRTSEVRRIPLLGTSVNRGKREFLSSARRALSYTC